MPTAICKPTAVSIKIATTNHAFQPAPQLELARILRSLANKVEHCATLSDLEKLPLRDAAGELAGEFTLA